MSSQQSDRLMISTARQHAERALNGVSSSLSSGCANMLHSVVNSFVDGVVIAAGSGDILFCNPSAQRLAGFARVGSSEWTDAAGCFLGDAVTPFPKDRLPIARALQGETSENVEMFLRADVPAQDRWIMMSASPFRDPSGTLIGAIAILRDISETRRSVGILERLSTAVESTSDSVVMTDARGIIVYVNSAFERTTGYSREEAVGATPRILKSGSHDRQYYKNMWATISSGEVFRNVLINRRKDGASFYAEQTITPVVGPDGTVLNYVSLMRDITERRRIVQQETELSLARDVQQRLYPRNFAHIRGYDMAGVMHPAGTQMVSGDYFDVFPTAGGSTAVALGDVCGHGISAALIMAQTRAYVRSLSLTHDDVNTVMRKVNDALVGDLSAENFVTLVIARFDPCGGTFTFGNAGHLAGYVLDERGEVRETLSSNGMALGFFTNRTYQAQPPVALGKGEMLLLFTDGIVESESPGAEEFGSARAVQTAAAHRELAAAAIAETMYETSRAFAEGAPQVDDMTVFVCKATGDCSE